MISNQFFLTSGFDAMLIKKSLRKCRLIGDCHFARSEFFTVQFSKTILIHICLQEALILELGLQTRPTRAFSDCRLKVYKILLSNKLRPVSRLRLQSKRADLSLRAEAGYIEESWLVKAGPIMMEKIIAGHAIRDEREKVYFDLLDNFNNFGFALTTTYLCSLFTILALSFFLNELVHRIRFSGERRIEVIKRIVLALSKFQSKRLSAVALFVLFAHLFFWHTQLFLTNNVKVEV